MDWYFKKLKSDGPDFTLVAGDIMDARWYEPKLIKQKTEQYWGGYVKRFKDYDITAYIAPGDHEYGDDKGLRMGDVSRLFGKQFTKIMGMPRNGPKNHIGRAYYSRHGGLLVITLDTFEDAGERFAYTVGEQQLAWMEKVLIDNKDAEFIIVQGHLPIVGPVKSKNSSASMMKNGTKSKVWKLMVEHGVDAYLCGEHHRITVHHHDGIWQIVHGALWGTQTNLNYLRGTCQDGQLKLELLEFNVTYSGGHIGDHPHPLASDLGLEASTINEDELASLFSGSTLPEGAKPLAQAYAGHQFGHFTMLGDGRAHLLGEHLSPDGKRFDIQLKGSGQTPFSRRGDGRAVLGPMLREYLISEAMAALGIPTTRALAVVTTGEDVQRETLLPGAILTRVAASHIRVGTFQFASATGDRAMLQALLDYTIQRHDPQLIDVESKALGLLDAAIHRQADLIVHWMRVGFIHGVMNTDNMTLSGETIDYGPCAFMDTYNPATVFSSIDHNGRYAYANQPAIAAWNLARLAEALLPMIDDDADKAIQLADVLVNRFAEVYKEKWLTMMRAKLGMVGEEQDDKQLISDLLAWMKKSQADYTNTFRKLEREMSAQRGRGSCQADEPSARCGSAGASPSLSIPDAWHTRWQDRLQHNGRPIEESIALMQKTNPAVIPRNHKVEEALEAATNGDLQPFHALHAVLQSPYEQRDTLAPYQSPPEPSNQVYQTFCGT
eukprot:g12032.t1